MASEPLRPNSGSRLQVGRIFSYCTTTVLIAATIAILAGIAPLIRFAWNWGPISPIDTPPVVSSTGPTVTQLEQLQTQVSTRIYVNQQLHGETSYLEGLWLVGGDALIGINMKKAEIKEKDDTKHEAVIVLPMPEVISPRVDHKKTQEVYIKSKSWLPFVGDLIGDKKALREKAMLGAQKLIEEAASKTEFKEKAQRDTEGILKEFYRKVDWTITVKRERPSESNSDGAEHGPEIE